MVPGQVFMVSAVLTCEKKIKKYSFCQLPQTKMDSDAPNYLLMCVREGNSKTNCIGSKLKFHLWPEKFKKNCLLLEIHQFSLAGTGVQ